MARQNLNFIALQETFRLLIHAARNAMAALPVLFYIMVVITLVVTTWVCLNVACGMW